MQNERQMSFKTDIQLPSQQKQTTYSNFIRPNINISLIKEKKLKQDSQASGKEQRRSESPTRSLYQQTEQGRSISLILSTHLPQLKGKNYKPRYSTFLLPKKRNTALLSKKYDFELPTEHQKYQFDLTDEYEFHKIDEDDSLRGISINIHLNSFLILGDIIVTLIIFTMSAFAALFVSFDDQEAEKLSVRLIHYICLGFLIVRNIIQCIKITTYKRKLIYKLKDIIRYRLTRIVFWVDFLIIIESIFYIYYYQSQLLGLATYLTTFFKVFFMKRQFDILERSYLDSSKQQMFWDLVKMMVLNIFFAHFFATILISLYYVNLQKNWIVSKNLQNQQWYIIYIWAFYWAAGIIPSIGFGDIVPVYYQQALIVALLKLFTYAIFVLIDLIRMQAILSIQQSLVRKIGIFHENAVKDQISQKLRQKIERYLKRKEKDDTLITYQERISFIQQLPTTLEKKYLQQFSSQRLRALPFFHLLSLKTLGQIALRIYDRFYAAKDMIILSGQSDKISILKCGSISFLYKRNRSRMNGTVVHKIQVDWNIQKIKNPFLIDHSFLQKYVDINFDVRAEMQTKILHINLKEFQIVMRQSEDDKEYFFQIIHRHQKEQNQWCQIQCQYCPKKYHTLFNCPKLHYFPFHDILYLKNTQPETFQVQNQRKILYKRTFTGYRDRFKRNRFYLRRFFSSLQRRIGVVPHGKPRKLFWPFNKLQDNIQQFSFQPKTSQVIPIKQKNSLSKLKLAKSKSMQYQTQFNPYINCFDEEYIQEQKRQICIEQKEKKKFRTLKNKLLNVIIQILQPLQRGFWKLQIDKMNDYKNYFSNQNPQNLRNVSINKKRKKKYQILAQKKFQN